MSQAEAMETPFQNSTLHSQRSEGQEATKKRDVLAHINRLYIEIGDQYKAYDYVQRASIAIKSASNKDKPSLALSREIRHEIVMDILRTDDWLSRLITKITNGSPSVTVIFGVAFSTITFII